MGFIAPILGIIGTIASVGGTIAQGVGAKRDSDAAARIENQNAQLKLQDAQEARIKATEDEAQTRLKTRRIKGEQKLGFASGGVDTTEGTPLLVTSETELLGEHEVDLIKRAGAVQARSFETQASMHQQQAKRLKSQGRSQLAGSILGGTAKLINAGSTLFSGFGKP